MKTDRSKIRCRSCSISKVVAGMIVLLGLSIIPCRAQFETEPPPKDWKVSVVTEYFYWQENDSGSKLLDESGPRFGVEVSYKEHPTNGILTAVRFRLYYGAVDYNGATMGGTPIKTTTDYLGGLGEFRLGYRWGLGPRHYLDLMGGVGFEDWDRYLTGSGGYHENWFPIYLKAGMDITPETDGWIGALGLKLPVYTIQNVDLSQYGFGQFTLHPEPRPSGYGEIGYQFNKNLSASAYFDSYWFGKSSTVVSGSIAAFQPESFTYQIGIKVSWTF
jgi:hypothetical protein